MKTSKLVEMLEFYDTFATDPDVLVDLGGRERAVTGVIDDQGRGNVILKLSERPSEKEYFCHIENPGSRGLIRRVVDTDINDVGVLAKMFPDTIYFEATLLT